MITKFKLFVESLTYDKDTQTMTGIYKVVSRDSDITTLENVQEIQELSGRKTVFYMDDKLSAFRITRIINLPSSKITIGEEVELGYFEVSIPYWLYKENMKSLKIHKLENKHQFRIKDRKDY